jgi:hypothetical protein
MSRSLFDGRVLRRPEEAHSAPRYDLSTSRDPYEYSRPVVPPQFDDRHVSITSRPHEIAPARFPARSRSVPDVLPAPRPSVIEEITRMLEAERAVNPPLGLYAGPMYDGEDSWD